MRASLSPRLLLAAAGTVLAFGGLANAQQLINVSGSSLLGSFIRGQASTNDYIGVTVQTPSAGTDIIGAGVWALNYRVSGSINGFDELIRYGYPQFVTVADNRTPGNTTDLNSLLLTDEWYNRSQYITAGVTSGVYNAANAGGQPQRAASNGANRAISGTTGGVTIDVAYLDVPGVWGLKAGTVDKAAPSRKPNQLGYGMNPRTSVGLNGSPTGSASGGGLDNSLITLGTRNLADFPGRDPLVTPYDANTIFEYPLTLAPVAPIANPGTGITRLKISEMQWLWSTGRAKTGENLVVATRDVGSGTRNAFNNFIGLDPSFGIGDNIGAQATLASQDQLGPTFWPTNKGATSGMLRTVRYHRLSVGYAGAETAVSGSSPSSWLSGNVLDIIDTFNDVYYTPAELASLFPGGPSASDYVRPTLANVLNNTRTGWVISGQAVVATIGDPKAEAATFRTATLPNDGGAASGNPAMVNKSAARYVNNILKSIVDFNATTPGSAAVATPAEFLSTNFTLIGAANNVSLTSDPLARIPNPNFSATTNAFVQLPGNSVFQNARYGTPNAGTLTGLSPRRFPLTSGSYSDGRGGPGQTNYITQGTTGINGNTVAYEAAVDSISRNVMGRNKIAFDFNGDSARNLADTNGMIAAWTQRSNNNTGTPWIAPTGVAGDGQDAVIEILGDANGDGSFTTADVRYFADGLALIGGNLNRKAGFKAVDDAFGGYTIAANGSTSGIGGTANFFGTTLATGKPYANGDSRGDIIGASGNVAPGWAPVGADGVINAKDIDYVYRNFKKDGIVGGAADWSDLAEAAITDLSADITGDLKVDQADVDELVTVILGTCKGDVNLNGRVNLVDRAIVDASIATPPATVGWATGDVNGDGAVTLADRSIVCPADFNCDGNATIDDLFLYFNAYFTGNSKADMDDIGGVGIDDLFLYINQYFTGC